MSVSSFPGASRISLILFWLAVPFALALLSSPLAAQHRAVPSQTNVLLLGHNAPEGPGCGQWGQLTMRSCERVGECRPEHPSAESATALYDSLDEEIEALVAETCAARDCPGFEYRNDQNHFECQRRDTCMQRSLAYRCIAAVDEPEQAPPARRTARRAAPATAAIDADATRLAMVATRPEVDISFSGNLNIGGKNSEWGEVIELRRSDAEEIDNGRCRFRYRFAAINSGDHPAGAHVNRVRLGEHVLLAEHDISGLDPGRRSNNAGLLTLWSGEHVLYAHLDDDEQLNDIDRSNNLRRVMVRLADGCADPRPRPRQMGEARHIERPVGRHQPPEPATPTGTRAPTTAPPPRPGTRAAPREGRPAPGTESKPVPDDALECRPQLAATRVTGVTRTGARTTAILAWEASAFALHGSGFSWDGAQNKSTQCELGFGWTCTVRGRPCRG